MTRLGIPEKATTCLFYKDCGGFKDSVYPRSRARGIELRGERHQSRSQIPQLSPPGTCTAHRTTPNRSHVSSSDLGRKWCMSLPGASVRTRVALALLYLPPSECFLSLGPRMTTRGRATWVMTCHRGWRAKPTNLWCEPLTLWVSYQCDTCQPVVTNSLFLRT